MWLAAIVLYQMRSRVYPISEVEILLHEVMLAFVGVQGQYFYISSVVSEKRIRPGVNMLLENGN